MSIKIFKSWDSWSWWTIFIHGQMVNLWHTVVCISDPTDRRMMWTKPKAYLSSAIQVLKPFNRVSFFNRESNVSWNENNFSNNCPTLITMTVTTTKIQLSFHWSATKTIFVCNNYCWLVLNVRLRWYSKTIEFN